MKGLKRCFIHTYNSNSGPKTGFINYSYSVTNEKAPVMPWLIVKCNPLKLSA